MHYKPRPSFKTKHWRRLYESRISDIKALKESANGTAFVIVDAEPWGRDNSEPAEIGLSLLPHVHVNLDCETMDTLPKTLDAASNLMGLETHWIRLIDRERRERGREQHRYGTQHFVSGDKVEDTIIGIIESFRDKTSGDAPLILAGFAVAFELQVLSNIYPDLLNYFTSWVDLQEVTSGMTDGIERPSLRETLIACGFEGYRHSQESRIARQHNAATDTVRTVMLLVRCLGLPSDRETLDTNHLKRNNNFLEDAQILLQPQKKRIIGKVHDPDRKNSTHSSQKYIVPRPLKGSMDETCSTSFQNTSQLLSE